jgi:hypothetical protein
VLLLCVQLFVPLHATNISVQSFAAAVLSRMGKLPPTQLVSDDDCGLTLPLYVIIEPHSEYLTAVKCTNHWPHASAPCVCVLLLLVTGTGLHTQLKDRLKQPGGLIRECNFLLLLAGASYHRRSVCLCRQSNGLIVTGVCPYWCN